jgi:hypothetical protein
MKNKLYIFGIVWVLIILVGCMFKVSHWPGAGVILTLGFLGFTLIFMPVALVKSYRNENDKSLLTLYVIAYVCVFVNCVGALFKIQHWPGAGLFMLSIPLPFVLFLPVYLAHIRKSKQLNYNNLLLVLFFFAYFAVVTALLSLDVGRNVLDEYVVATYNQEQSAELNRKQTNALIEAADSLTKTQLLAVKEKTDMLILLIDNMKVGIVKNVDIDNQRFVNQDGTINYWQIEGKDIKEISTRHVFQAKANELKNNLIDYRGYLNKTLPDSMAGLHTYINKLLDTSGDWTFNKFDNRRLIVIIETLSNIKNAVTRAELETISGL